MDAVSIVSAVQSLKTAKDIAQALHGLKVTSEVQAQVSELLRHLIEAQRQVLTAQAEYGPVVQRVDELEAELLKLKDWSAEREHYELKQVGDYAFAYAPKESVETGKPPHLLCCCCYDEGTKSILQYRKTTASCKLLGCSRCNEEVCLPGPPPVAPPRSVVFSPMR